MLLSNHDILGFFCAKCSFKINAAVQTEKALKPYTKINFQLHTTQPFIFIQKHTITKITLPWNHKTDAQKNINVQIILKFLCLTS